jgi:hypothetical protein
VIVYHRHVLEPKNDFFLCEFSVLSIDFDYGLKDVDGKIVIRFYDSCPSTNASKFFDFDTGLLWTTFDDDDNILIMSKKSFIQLTLLITKKFT